MGFKAKAAVSAHRPCPEHRETPELQVEWEEVIGHTVPRQPSPAEMRSHTSSLALPSRMALGKSPGPFEPQVVISSIREVL